jgi:hypothetical protein
MAGLEQPSNGETALAPGVSAGILLQEPPLDGSKTVLGNVEQAVAQTTAMLDRYTALTQLLAEDYSDALLEEMAAAPSHGRPQGDPDPTRPAAGQPGHRGTRPEQALRGSGLFRRPVVLVAPQRDRGRCRAQRCGQDHAVPDPGRRGAA